MTRGNQDEPMEEAEAEQEEDELPMPLESLRMWSWCSRTCTWPSSSLTAWIYKELTSWRSVWVHYGEGTNGTSRKRTPKSWATIADGVYSSSRSKAAQIRSPVLEICAQGTCQHLLCKESHWTINEGEVKLLTWESSPSSHAQDGKKIRGDRAHAGNSCLSLSSSNLQVTAYNTRHQEEESLVLEGHHTYLCAAGVNWTREGLLHQVGWTSSFARPTSSLSTRSWMGDSNSSSPSIGWTLQASPAQP
ncbi:unnamed protein product [Microthlaspi erraticum]|uniref:Arabidopsis retrotransposon Orf1 C-terminal domain-containing protein n=1 Tax=Microthlaspi erraticum TaxID=1685480 RepID=A0A6D2K0M9_9BRAS|nr:unnamed protein product [Microthlaspi erraticum]